MRYTRFIWMLTVTWAAAQTGQTPPYSDIKEPAGQKVEFRFHTLPHSVQIYTCKTANGTFTWAGPDPDAILIDQAQKLTVHHYKGPTWEATAGGMVRSDGPMAKHFRAQNANSVDWLELPAKDGAGRFAGVTYIHRIATSGGLAPAGAPCDAQHAGDQERVPYSATYLFYSPK